MSDKPDKVTFRPQDGGGYVVFTNGDRLGFVRQQGPRWYAADTYLARVGFGGYKSRRNAVKALLDKAGSQT